MAQITPPYTSGVADDPVTSFDIHANDLGCMISGRGWAVGEYSASVWAECRSICHNTKSASVENMINHGLLALHLEIFCHRNSVVILRLVALQDRWVVRPRTVISYAASCCYGIEGGQIVATIAVWWRVSAVGTEREGYRS